MTMNKGSEKASEGSYIINGVKLSNGTFDGKFLPGRQLTIEPDETSDVNVTGWTVFVDGKQTDYAGAKLELTTPTCTSMVITALLDGAVGIKEIKSTPVDSNVYDLNGRKVRTGSTSPEGLPSGIYIINGKKVVK